MTSEISEAAPRYIRLQIEIIAEVVDEDALRSAAVTQVNADDNLEPEEREEALQAIEIDPTGAIAHFVDPVALIDAIPGVELAEAGWETEPVEYDPEAEDIEEYGEE